ncbi:M28 family peptidase [Henriciella marina]|uniref:M28 family peptidase n=1 Tax=Henriciella marina TaxID=453851 RepID=UPI0003697C78|nr:M28 family peptidase [Henriciella marina]
MIRCIVAAGLFLAACSSPAEHDTNVAATVADREYTPEFHDADRALSSLETLSSDAFEGRRTGEPGNLKAREWITTQLEGLGVPSLSAGTYDAPFDTASFSDAKDSVSGTNVLAVIEAGPDAPVIVMSAHFDHLGIGEDGLYNGADDNASGVSALLETIAWFQKNPPENTIVFAFFDAEEMGIAGSAAFVRDLPPSIEDRVAFNLNLDMVSRADKGEIFAVGTHHFPDLVPLIDRVATSTPLTLKRGHDSPEWGEQDWSALSDHAPFLRAGLPIIYLGVEDHADYHRVTDTFDKVAPETFARAIDTIILVAEAADDWVAQEAG